MVPLCMWYRRPPISPLPPSFPSLSARCVHKPSRSCLNPGHNEMARTSLWLPSDDLLVLSLTDKSTHKGGIDPHKEHLSESSSTCVCVCLCVSTVPWTTGPHSLTARPTSVPSQPRLPPSECVGTRSQSISLGLQLQSLSFAWRKGKLRWWGCI